MWHARTEGSLFSTPLSAVSAPDRAPSSPFPEDDIEVDEHAFQGSEHSPALAELQAGLRGNVRAWRAVARLQ
jgi:hypothetical protein